MRVHVFTLFFISLLHCAGECLAQTKPMNTVTTAVPFLRITPDARAAGMGDIGMATMPDASALFYNMGKVVFNKASSGLGVTYTPWLRELELNDNYLLATSGFMKLDENQALSAGLRYFSQGSFQLTDDAGNNTTTVKPNDLAIEGGYSRKLTARTGIGLSLRFIHSRLANTSSLSSTRSGKSVAADIGYYYNAKPATGEGLSFGVALTNLGSRISYTNNADQKDYIPANLGTGIAYTKNLNEDNRFTLGLDLNKLLVPTPPDADDATGMAEYRDKGTVGSWFSSLGDAPGGFSEELKEFQVGVGGEYTYHEQFSFRAGYFFENEGKGNRKYATLGAGLNYKIAALNFSYLIPSQSMGIDNALSNTLRFSLLFNFK